MIASLLIMTTTASCKRAEDFRDLPSTIGLCDSRRPKQHRKLTVWSALIAINQQHRPIAKETDN